VVCDSEHPHVLNLFNQLFVVDQSLVQYAALPFREGELGLEVALITSRGGGRWIIPKGWPEPGLSPPAVAANEAFEEAGLEGDIGETAIGSLTQRKRLHLLASAACRLEVFPLSVRTEHASWPECKQRQRVWLDPDAAARKVEDQELARLILDFASSR
jgi:8-oxo-dGTP pyrophosphatase MutT (NUDIX family)